MSQSVIYISNELISVVQADIKRDAIIIEKHMLVPLKEGTMLNGVILDEHALKKGLQQVHDAHFHEVTLIIDSAKILAKKAIIPRMNEKETLQFVEDELSIVENQNKKEYLYDYAYLGKDENNQKASQILCVGVEREFMKSYIDIFGDVGIRLLHIDYAINVLISFVDHLPGLIDKTFAISQIDGQNMISVLFIEHQYTLTNRSRLFADKGTPQYDDEIMETISQLRQFASSNHQSAPMSDIYFFGISQKEENDLWTMFSQITHIDMKKMPSFPMIYTMDNSDFEISQYVYCLGYLMGR